MNHHEGLTGRSRLRVAIVTDGSHILVLQVELKSHSAPVRRWRDATIEDLSQSATMPSVSLAPCLNIGDAA